MRIFAVMLRCTCENRGKNCKQPSGGEQAAAPSRIARGVRKVRTPQGRMPGNARAPRGDGKCNRKHTARLVGGGVPPGRLRAAGRVRVKRGGKSSPRPLQGGRQCKPHPVQDQVSGRLRAARSRPRVGCKDLYGDIQARQMAEKTEFGLWSPPEGPMSQGLRTENPGGSRGV